ncbi:DUF6037 domain-containing protein [Erysipelothrix urinaevulpis]|uniref:DUF6037 family protein n=1 Tax=Erysipelothrix urinaevulpis TaxID=2683717 RepID=UPI0013582F0C|nr:DUF6037 family protein [Erysipelothrix urinaevulpis]
MLAEIDNVEKILDDPKTPYGFFSLSLYKNDYMVTVLSLSKKRKDELTNKHGYKVQVMLFFVKKRDDSELVLYLNSRGTVGVETKDLLSYFEYDSRKKGFGDLGFFDRLRSTINSAIKLATYDGFNVQEKEIISRGVNEQSSEDKNRTVLFGIKNNYPPRETRQNGAKSKLLYEEFYNILVAEESNHVGLDEEGIFSFRFCERKDIDNGKYTEIKSKYEFIVALNKAISRRRKGCNELT